ncbi:MAG: hypothetical protein AB1538_11745 [Bacillota bacterium]
MFLGQEGKQMDRPTEEEMKAWRAKYGAILEFSTEEGYPNYCFVCRMPDRQALRRYVKRVAKDVYEAAYSLLLECLLYPSDEEARRLFKEKPGIPFALGSELQKAVEADLEFHVKRS